MKKKAQTRPGFRTQKSWVNKYTVTLLLFVGWLLFFDKYNFFAQRKLQASTNKLELEYTDLKEEIKIARKEKEDLLLNQEKYGREKYYLHKDGEDVFIIE